MLPALILGFLICSCGKRMLYKIIVIVEYSDTFKCGFSALLYCSLSLLHNLSVIMSENVQPIMLLLLLCT